MILPAWFLTIFAGWLTENIQHKSLTFTKTFSFILRPLSGLSISIFISLIIKMFWTIFTVPFKDLRHTALLMDLFNFWKGQHSSCWYHFFWSWTLRHLCWLLQRLHTIRTRTARATQTTSKRSESIQPIFVQHRYQFKPIDDWYYWPVFPWKISIDKNTCVISFGTAWFSWISLSWGRYWQ